MAEKRKPTKKGNHAAPRVVKKAAALAEKADEPGWHEEASRLSEAVYQQIVDTMEDSLAVLDADGGILFANSKAALNLSGGPPSNVVGKNISRFVPKAQAEQLTDTYRRVITTGRPLEQEVMVTLQDVDQWFLNSLRPVSFGIHNIPAVVANSRNITERKKTEAEILKYRSQFENYFRKHDAVFLLMNGETGQLLDANDAALRFYGYSMPQMKLMKIGDINCLPPDELRAERERALREEKKYFIVPHRLANGEIRTVEVHTTPVVLTNETYLFSVIHDITERKRMEQALRENKERLDFLISSSPAVIYTSKVEGDFGATFVSENVSAQLGYEPHQFTEDPRFWVDRIHPDDAPRILADVPRVFEQGRHSHEYRFRSNDGSYRWMYDELRLVRDALGRPVEIVGFWVDITARKRAEEALRQNEQRLRVALALINMAVFNQDRDLRYTWMYQPQLGYTTEKVVGKTDYELMPPDAAQQAERIKRQVFVSNQGARGQVQVATNSGTFYYDLIVEPLLNELGEVVGVTGASLDITERKKIEDARMFLLECGTKGDDFFQSLAQYLARSLGMDFICIDRLEGDLLTASTVAVFSDGKFEDNVSYKLHDTPCGEVVGREVCCFLDGVRQRFPKDAVLQDMKAESYVGVTLWSHTHQPIGLIAAIGREPLNDTRSVEAILKLVAIRAAAELERKQAEAKIVSAKEEWEQTFDAMNDIVTIQDKDMRILRANKAAHAAFQVEPGGLDGRHCYEVFRGTNGPCPNCPELVTLHDHKTASAPITHEMLGKTFLVTSSPALDDQGGFKHLVHIARDITAYKKMEDELLQAQKMEAIGILAGGIAHDFNNILAAILGYADMARDDLPAASKTRSDLDEILKAGNRAKALVKQILTFSRKGQEMREPLLPAPIVKEALKLLRASLPSTIEIHEEIDPDCGAILTNPTNFHQVVVNLCTNAFHAMENEKGVLTVRLTRKQLPQDDAKAVTGGKFVELLVQDTGCGMDQATLARIFEPYFTTKEAGKGTGMGLALVHGIVAGHGGFIRVESEPGKSSTFHLYFPAIQEKPAKVEGNKAEPLPRGNERILAVDDEASIVGIYKTTLERLGYKVTAYLSSKEALAAFRSSPDSYDLVVTDQTMPNLPGSELAKELLRIRPDILIVLCTGYSSMIAEQKAKEIGIAKFLMKPFSPRDLAITIRHVIDRRQG